MEWQNEGNNLIIKVFIYITEKKVDNKTVEGALPLLLKCKSLKLRFQLKAVVQSYFNNQSLVEALLYLPPEFLTLQRWSFLWILFS